MKEEEEKESTRSTNYESSTTTSTLRPSLDRRYLYQNPTTGAVSSTTLTVRQLCRMLCPPTASTSSTNNSAPSLFHADTQVLALVLEENDDDEGPEATSTTPTYDPAGWKSAKEIPILKHAACPVFYYTQVASAANDTSDLSLSKEEKSTATPVLTTQGGPVSCRQLSGIMMGSSSSSSSSQYDPQKSQVYGESTGNEWVTLQAMPDLELALEAFRDAVPLSQAAASLPDDKATKETQNEYDASIMVFDDAPLQGGQQQGDDDGSNTIRSDNHKQREHSEIHDELEAFLSSTDHIGPKGLASSKQRSSSSGHVGVGDMDEDTNEGYESDGGTKYVKDPRTGNWIHQALAPWTQQGPKHKKNDNHTQAPTTKKLKTQHPSNTVDADTNNNNNSNKNAKKKNRKAKFAAKNAKNWIYISGLPADTDEDEVGKFFAKVGIIDLDPETQRPKIKVYRHKTDSQDPNTGAVITKKGACKGDASLCYARPESVALALQVLDEAPFRDEIKKGPHNNINRVHVERAKFEQSGDFNQAFDKKKRVSQMQRKVAKLAAKQAMDWDDGESNGRLTGGVKGLRIIVLKGMFHPSELSEDEEDDEDAFLAELEQQVRRPCEAHGVVEKITVFSKNPQGVVVVKFTQPGSASEAIKTWDGLSFGLRKQKRKVEAIFWDGVEDFTVRDEEKELKEMEKRHDEFGAWLDSQADEELPEEFRLKVEE